MVVVDPHIDPFTGQTWTDSCSFPDSWGDMNRLVIQNADLLNPNFDWGRFDKRINYPNYNCDNSDSPTSDGQIDYVVFMYKYSNTVNWGAADVIISELVGNSCNGLDTIIQSSWTGSGGGVDVAYVGEVITPSNGDTLDFGGMGMTFPLAFGGTNKQVSTTLHELTHTMYGCPHYFSGNNVAGEYFNRHTTGWGGTAQTRSFYCMTAWERWYLDYITPIEPIQDTIIQIDDFINTGDAIRIEVPFSKGQHLWIENHTGIHEFDHHSSANEFRGPGNESLMDSPSGIYIYVENIAGERSYFGGYNVTVKGGNGIKLVNASGNHDYYMDLSVADTLNAKNQVLHQTQRKLSNPISGGHPLINYRQDFNQDSIIQYSSNFNAGGNQEHRNIDWEIVNGVNEKFLYRSSMADSEFVPEYSRSPAFLEGDSVGIGTNPTIFNYPKFVSSSTGLDTVFINGLKIKILNIDNTGKATIEVKFQETEIRNDVRWTGKIHVPNISDENSDLILDSKIKLTLDVSRTADQRNFNYITGNFVSPSEMTISSDASLLMKDSSNFTILNHSKLIIEEGAEVVMKNGACIVVEDTGILELRGNDITMMGEDALIIIKSGGTLRTADGMDFTFHTEDDIVNGVIVNKAGGYIAFEAGNIVELGEGSNFVITRPSFPETKSILMLEDASLNIQGDHKLELRNVMIEYNNDSKIHIEDGVVDLDYIKMVYDGNGHYGGVTGIEGTNLSECFIYFLESTNIGTTAKFDGYTSPGTHNLNSLNIKDGDYGVVANDLGAYLSISGSSFQGLDDAAAKLSNLKYVLLDANDVEDYNSVFPVEGYDIENVGFADINRGSVRDCMTGISALNSNVFLRRGQTIEHNTNGIVFEDSGTANYALTVGDIGCANIIFNDVGVSGDNIIMNIDAIEHAANNNDPVPKANRFNGNTLLFDICYNHPTLVNDSPTILMKGNYFGGGGYLSIPSSFTINYPNGGAPCHYGVAFDDMDFVTVEPTYNCEYVYYPTPLPFPDKVKCIVEKADVDILVHEQSRSAHLELVEDDLLEAQSLYQPIADLTSQEANYDPSCLNKIYFARCMALADIDNTFIALFQSEEWEENVIVENTKNTTEYFSIFPNPATDLINIQNKYDAEFEIRIINTYGKEVYRADFVQQLELDTNMFERGIYFVSILDKSLKKSVQKKIVIQ